MAKMNTRDTAIEAVKIDQIEPAAINPAVIAHPIPLSKPPTFATIERVPRTPNFLVATGRQYQS